MKFLIFILSVFIISTVCGQTTNTKVNSLYTDVYKAFQDKSKRHFYINTGRERQEIEKYLTSPKGFSANYYRRYKNEIDKGGALVVSIIKDPFLYYNKINDSVFKEILKDNFDLVLKRINNNETFYIFEKGEKVNTLILCGQNKADISKLLKSLFVVNFVVDALDSDSDGLPDYYEKQIGTNFKKNDTDSDGLSDYDEHFKYLTNPLQEDSDGDGIDDSDWNERREYTYSIYAKREVNAPFDTAFIDDYFQDIRNVTINGEVLSFEILLFPKAANIVIPNSKKTKSVYNNTLYNYIAPSYFCNYSENMKTELNGIIKDWDYTNSYDLAFMFSSYIIDISKNYPANGPIGFYIKVEDGKVNIVHKEEFNSLKTQYYPTDQRVLNNQTFGESMYRNRMHGSCGSSSIYINTMYRAINIPTRIISSSPIINYSDSSQIKLLHNLKNKSYRESSLANVRRFGEGRYANHFFYELYLNGRWVRCDYKDINIACEHSQGLFIVQDKFVDFSEKNFADTWGRRMIERKGNPYTTTELSDQFPIHKP